MIKKYLHELYRFFYIVEGKPYPYSEKLSLYVTETKFGRKFKPYIDKIINMVVGLGYERKIFGKDWIKQLNYYYMEM